MELKYMQQPSWTNFKMQDTNIYSKEDNDQELVHNFKIVLQQLTFNSKPIISELTDLAKRYISIAPLIVEAIENQINNVQRHQKLPLMYLMDSICKNIGGTYLSLFSLNLTKLFGQTYNLVDSDTQMKLKRLVNTWKDYPKGPLFSQNILESLNSIINQFQKKDENFY
ncbi:hypothetical protein LY90DRAFT_507320 [Neocallimastix californiae]|uniref:CID domain-containing protein n=1 Tax=Neocallimastix californiae TaxID=1754190 RepID=A0A1Y2D6K2_9FUNG|nr:hypothetical protein LY90DRAFT_507320 [Neocallimastix californiae]|eukprot:ORY54900.1 hypothetical protein LY90DRAFT_507320 [Neocallimastix californiae]